MTRVPRREVTVDERTGEKTSKTSEKGVSYTSEVRTRGGRAEEGVVDTRHEL